MLEIKSTTTSICFKPQKTEYLSTSIFCFELSQSNMYFSFYIYFDVPFILCFFCLQAWTEEYKHMHLRISVHLMFLLSTSYFFWLYKANRYGSFYIYWDLSYYCHYLMFQVFKFLKWRVQPCKCFKEQRTQSLSLQKWSVI